MRISDWSSDVCSSDLVHLDAADGRQVIAFWIEEQPREQRLGGLARRRFARAHHAIDVAERLVALLGLVGHQRVADPRTDIDMVDVEQFDLVEARLVQPFEVFGRKLVARLDIDFAGGLVDEIIGGIGSEEHTSELQSLMRISYAVFCLKKKKKK